MNTIRLILLLLFPLNVYSQGNIKSVAPNRARFIKIQDAGDYYTGTEVETALQEIGAGTTLDSLYLRLDGTTTPTADIGWGGYDINDLGQVGIGTATPSYPLDILSSDAAAGNTFINYTDSEVARTTIDSRGLQKWYVNNGEAEAGSIQFSTPGGYPGIGFYDVNGLNRADIRHGAVEGLILGSHTVGTAPDPALIVSKNCVGIGNLDPSAYNSSANNLVIGAGGAGQDGLTIAGTVLNSIYFAVGTTGTDLYKGYFRYRNAENALEVGVNAAQIMEIRPEGVGIGETAPAAKLEVLSTTQQLKLSYSNGVDFNVTVANTGDSTITSSGGDISFGDENLTTTGTFEATTITEGGAGVLVATDVPGMTSTKDDIIFAMCITDIDDTCDDIAIPVPRATTITKVLAMCIGGTNVVGRLYEVDGDGDDSDAVGVETSDWTFTTSETEDSSFNNATLDAGDYLQWDTTIVSGSVTTFRLTVYGYET